jgi:hypothetical protein
LVISSYVNINACGTAEAEEFTRGGGDKGRLKARIIFLLSKIISK